MRNRENTEVRHFTLQRTKVSTLQRTKVGIYPRQLPSEKKDNEQSRELR